MPDASDAINHGSTNHSFSCFPEMPHMNRRNFLRCSAVLGGGALLSPFPLLADTGKAQGTNASRNAQSSNPAAFSRWYRRPLRILQTVLRESDARNYDANAVVRFMESADYNTLIVNAGGIVDFFKNPLPAANPNPFMGDRDVLREITQACRAAGLRVIGRVDFRGVEEHVFTQHPDWFALDAAGKPLQLDYTRPRLYASCYTGHYRNEHAEALIRHLLEHYELDGIWHNSIGFDSICYCPRCREGFRKSTGADLPDAESASPAELARYMEWKTSAAAAHMARMRSAVKAFGEDKAYAAEVFSSMFNPGGRIGSGVDLYMARDNFDFMVSVAFPLAIGEPRQYAKLHHAGTLVRFMKSLAPEKEAVILYGENGTLQRYIMEPPADLRVYLWEALAAGGRFWNCNFTGSYPDATHDRRNAFNPAEVYRFVRDHEGLLAHHAPVANVGIYYSRPTRLFYRNAPPEEDRFSAGIEGAERALMEGHVPYDFVPDDSLSVERLRKYRVLILPNVRCLSQSEIEQIRRYVWNGGGLLATFATSLHDGEGVRRADFGLAEVFGCHFAGSIEDTRRDSYQFILKPDHPLVAADSGRTELLFNAAWTVLCRPAHSANVVCTCVPPIPNQPPEKAWTQSWPREYPTVIEHRYGAGRVIYFANQPDQINDELGHPDAAQLLVRGIRLLSDGLLPVESTAPESVHIGLTESLVTPGQYILSIVNTTSAPERPVRQVLPVFDLEIRLRLDGSKVESHQVLRAQGRCRVDTDGPNARVRLARLDDFCAVHFRVRR